MTRWFRGSVLRGMFGVRPRLRELVETVIRRAGHGERLSVYANLRREGAFVLLSLLSPARSFLTRRSLSTTMMMKMHE